jgi:hypothetical protein
VSDPESKKEIKRFPRLAGGAKEIPEFLEWKASLNRPQPKPINTTLPGDFTAPNAWFVSGGLPSLGKRS